MLDQLPFMNGAIYWTLREFAVSPGWTAASPCRAGDRPDGLHHKGLIAYDGTEKPAFAVAQQLFGDDAVVTCTSGCAEISSRNGSRR